MKPLLLSLVLLVAVSCHDDDAPPPTDPVQLDGMLGLLNFLPIAAYAPTDTLAQYLPNVAGVWRLTGANGGGTTGGPPPVFTFDRLLLRNNQVYGLVADGELMEYGFLRVDTTGSADVVVGTFEARGFPDAAAPSVHTPLNGRRYHLSFSPAPDGLYLSDFDLPGGNLTFERD